MVMNRYGIVASQVHLTRILYPVFASFADNPTNCAGSMVNGLFFYILCMQAESFFMLSFLCMEAVFRDAASFYYISPEFNLVIWGEMIKLNSFFIYQVFFYSFSFLVYHKE